jgi:crotonobetainyl-CoA:carnitine CoA-transferase CaiB-like acyl-CoA transferase
MLADLGASVTKIAAPPTARSTSAWPGAGNRRELGEDLDRQKTIIHEGEGLADGSWHVVIDDRVETGPRRTSGQPTLAVSPRVHVTITAFGLDGPRAHWTGSEFVALAAGGGMVVVCDDDGQPVPTAGWQGLLSTGYVAALAALDGLNLAKTGSRLPVSVDVSARDAVVFTFTYLECAHHLLKCPGTSGGRRYTAPAGVFRASDGSVRLIAVDDHQWHNARRALGEPDWAKTFLTVEDRRDRAAELNSHVESWTSERPKAVVADLLQRNGVPSTPVNTAAEVLESVHLWERGYFEKAGTSEGTAHRPPFDLTVTTAPSEKVGAADFWDSGGGRSLDQISIIEATHVISGPIAGALLGGMGAHVIRLEDVDRLDMYRRIGPFADGIAGLESGAYFLAANLNKQSLAFAASNLSDLREVTASSDVVLENVRAKRLERWELDLADIASAGRLTVSVSGFGRTGPLAHYRAYANNIHAYAGLTDATRTRDGQLANIWTVLADISTSLITSIVIAAWALGPCAGRPADADIAMLEVMVARLADRIRACKPVATDLLSWSMREDGAFPNDVFRTADGSQIAITVRDDAQWAALCDVVGADATKWASAAERADHLEDVYDQMSRQMKLMTGDQLASSLQARGVPAARVMTPEESCADEELRGRGLFRLVDHATRGSYWALCQPWRVCGHDSRTWTGAPVLGDWNKRQGFLTPAGDEQH